VNTQSHILMGALLFGRAVPRNALAGAAGGFLPDVPMLSIVAALKFAGTPDRIIFGEMYWERWWQVTNAIAHSFLLWGGLLVLCLTMTRRGAPARWHLGLAFCGAAVLHSVLDFLVHREDAHMHFWPLSDWKFVSPVSYWNPEHYGRAFSLFEVALGVVMAALLFRRHGNMAVRALLVLAIVIYVAVPAYFMGG